MGVCYDTLGADDDLDVHDIGARRPGHKQFPGFLKEGVGVVVIQVCLRIEAMASCPTDRVAINNCTRGIGWAVRSIGSC